MATAKRTTRTVTQEVTEYTLALTAQEREYLVELVGGQYPTTVSASIYRALTDAVEESGDSRPLAIGDRVRVLRPFGLWHRTEILEIRDHHPDSDNEIFVRHDIRGTGYLPADGEGTVWERVTNV